MHTCRYCKSYHNVRETDRRKEYNKKKVDYFRFCDVIKKEVTGETEPCEDFCPSKYFWCDSDHNWMFIVACLNRDCDCYQKEQLHDSIRGFDIGKEFDMKPRLVLKEKKEPKPILKLKKKEKIVLIPKKPKLVLKKKTNVVLLRRKT